MTFEAFSRARKDDEGKSRGKRFGMARSRGVPMELLDKIGEGASMGGPRGTAGWPPRLVLDKRFGMGGGKAQRFLALGQGGAVMGGRR